MKPLGRDSSIRPLIICNWTSWLFIRHINPLAAVIHTDTYVYPLGFECSMDLDTESVCQIDGACFYDYNTAHTFGRCIYLNGWELNCLLFSKQLPKSLISKQSRCTSARPDVFNPNEMVLTLKES